MVFFCELLPGQLFFGEITKRGVRVLGGKLVFPWFIVLVARTSQNIFQVILSCIKYLVHKAWVAGLSLRSDWAIEDCCNLGNIL
jgi:hypothetical protein